MTNVHHKLLPLAVLTLIVFLALGCSGEEKTLPLTDAGAGIGFPDQELFGAIIRLTQEDRPRLTIRAPHISRFEAGRTMLLDGGIKTDFFDNQGNHKAVLTAEEGEVIEGVNRFTARGRVVVVSDSGVVLRGEELHFEETARRIESDGFVTIISAQDSLAGYGFSAAPDLTEWEIKNTSGATWRAVQRDTTQRDSGS